ncbi:hypothetical protein J4465_02530 [Candidatus Pacearchaeota archaeon]|nr:hypothetical protein [Candidatus Pacearchaeota archaeon]
MEFLTLIQQLRKQTEKRNFDQTFDLIINLKDFDVRKESLNTSLELPVIPEKKKICAFLENPSSNVDHVITKADVEKLDLKQVKALGNQYDFFIASAKLMPTIAAKFGKVLGVMGKMPDPKIGSVIMQETEDNIKRTVEKLSKTLKIKAKEPSVKLAIGKESMKDEDLAKNASAVYDVIINSLSKREANVRSIMLKFTMGKPVKIKPGQANIVKDK